MAIKVYYDNDTNMCHIAGDDYRANKIRLTKNGNSVYLEVDGVRVIDGIPVTDLSDKNGNPYADYPSFRTAIKDFFKPAESDLIQKLNTLNDTVASSGGSTLKSFSVEIIRPANQTPYSAGDVLADTTAAFIPFVNVAKAIGAGVKIVRVRLQTDDTSVAGTKFNIHLYKDAPTFIADNSAFAVAYANATKRIGAIPVIMGTGNLGTVGMNDYNIAMCNPVARNIYFIIETVTGFTASANSTKFTITIDCELSNN